MNELNEVNAGSCFLTANNEDTSTNEQLGEDGGDCPFEASDSSEEYMAENMLYKSLDSETDNEDS